MDLDFMLMIHALLFSIRPGLHEPQLPVERSVTLVSSIVAERRRYELKSAASLNWKRIKKLDAPLNLQ